MRTDSSRALLGLCCLLVLTGLLLLSPSASFLLMALAACLALAPTIFGKKSIRIAGLFLLVASLTLAAWFFPAFQKEHGEFVQRGKTPAAPGQGTLPDAQKKTGN